MASCKPRHFLSLHPTGLDCRLDELTDANPGVNMGNLMVGQVGKEMSAAPSSQLPELYLSPVAAPHLRTHGVHLEHWSSHAFKHQ